MLLVELPNNSAMHGAAYQVLFQATSPHNCVTYDRRAQILEEFARIIEWAQSQPPHVLEAYQWAANHLTSEIDRRIKQNELSNQVSEVLKSLPKPPPLLHGEVLPPERVA